MYSSESQKSVSQFRSIMYSPSRLHVHALNFATTYYTLLIHYGARNKKRVWKADLWPNYIYTKLQTWTTKDMNFWSAKKVASYLLFYQIILLNFLTQRKRKKSFFLSNSTAVTITYIFIISITNTTNAFWLFIFDFGEIRSTVRYEESLNPTKRNGYFVLIRNLRTRLKSI